ncbi:hypothetical protein ARALYDRAFT_917893 [Arabidopsis lyrata subsp. lyrata]|uniref:Uncharacterized protein n=1 Tax=Arabidopsis lyrata subsp. lyrata TaxID=81972 RepID=D7MNP2_ARALL|nr:hypothetical protein ARALYDRAFT_917893 [Arabidopsis lyrata subsp. lyrata]
MAIFSRTRRVTDPLDDDARLGSSAATATLLRSSRSQGQHANTHVCCKLLPNVFVGKEENLRTIVRESCDAAKRSLKSRGLSLPPWRRSSYLQHKWFSPYKRKVGSSLGVKPLNSDAVSCRSLGYDDGAVNTRLFIRA